MNSDFDLTVVVPDKEKPFARGLLLGGDSQNWPRFQVDPEDLYPQALFWFQKHLPDDVRPAPEILSQARQPWLRARKLYAQHGDQIFELMQPWKVIESSMDELTPALREVRAQMLEAGRLLFTAVWHASDAIEKAKVALRITNDPEWRL